MQFIYQTDQDNQQVYLRISGELDAGSAPSIEGAIRDLADRGHVLIIVDATELTYISSAGVGAFIATLDLLKGAGGDIRFSGLRPNVRRVFDLLGLDQVFTIQEEEIK